MKKIVTVALFLGGTVSAMPIKGGQDPFFGLSLFESDEDTSNSYSDVNPLANQTATSALPYTPMHCASTEKQTHEIIANPLPAASASSSSMETASNASPSSVVGQSNSQITPSNRGRVSILGKRKSPEPEVARLQAQPPVHEDPLIKHFNTIVAQEIASPALMNPAYFVLACDMIIAMHKKNVLRTFHVPLGLAVRALEDPNLGARLVVSLNEILQSFPLEITNMIMQLFNRP